MAASIKAPPSQPLPVKRFAKELEQHEQQHRNKRICRGIMAAENANAGGGGERLLRGGSAGDGGGAKPATAAGSESAKQRSDEMNYTTEPINVRKRSISPIHMEESAGRRLADAQTPDGAVAAGAAPQPQTQEEQTKPNTAELEKNADYVALCAALSLLKSQRALINQDVLTLGALKQKALAEPEAFFEKLMHSRETLRLPKPVKLVKAPIVQWSKYKFEGSDTIARQLKNGIGMCSCGKGSVKAPDDGLFRNYRMFDKNHSL